MTDATASRTYELVRNHAALFDLSAEGRFFVSGADAEQAVNAAITADLEAIPELKALNTLALTAEGAIIAMLWVLKDEDGIWIICDPDRRDAMAACLAQAVNGCAAELEDRTDTTCCLAVIGPDAQEIAMEAAGEDIVGVPYLGLEPNADTDSLVCRLGYTGEFDFRFIAAATRRAQLRDHLHQAGASFQLGDGDTRAMPSLMLEMRSLHQASHIPADADAIQAGLHWMIDFRKESFVGKEAVERAKAEPTRKAVMLILEAAAAPEIPAPIRIEDQVVGECVYATWSPTLGKLVGLGYIVEELAWVGVVFDVAGGDAAAVSAPLFITQTVSRSQ
jgi:glycine cleavage system aminomethyltransferase T